MSNLAVLRTDNEERSDHQQREVVKLLEDTLAQAKEGKFTEIFLVGRYRDPDAEGAGYKFAHSVLFNRIQILGFLQLFQHNIVRDVLDE
jgi:hypothetical protein